jgi:hypothetical protein
MLQAPSARLPKNSRFIPILYSTERNDFMKDQILDFAAENPVVLLFVPLLLVFSFYRRYQRMKRRAGNLNDEKSNFLLVIGFIGAAIAIAIFLAYS